MTRSLAAAAAAVLVLGAALGGCDVQDPGMPADASWHKFCAVQGALYTDLGLPDGTAPETEDKARSLRDWAREMEETGTPEGIPDNARAGLEVMVEELRDVEAADLERETPFAGVSRRAWQDVEAYSTYVSDECAAVLPGRAELR